MTDDLRSEVSALVPADSKSMIDVQATRAIAQVQGSMTIAKKFPRDENRAIARIKQACGRRGLAEVAEYEYARGGTQITGPSIRLAEALAQNWGNIDSGIVELSRDHGESQMMAYCVDLETNYWKNVTFAVPHIRDKKGGGTKLTESRDIYEAIMNQGSRRLRNCILAIIPGDIIEMATTECENTLRKNTEPLDKRIPKMMAAMKELGVTQKMIELKFQCNQNALTERQLSQLGRIWLSIRDGIGSPGDFFQDEKTAFASQIDAHTSQPPQTAKVDPVAAPVTTSPAAATTTKESKPVQSKAPDSPAPKKPGDFDADAPAGLFAGKDDPRQVK